MVRGLDLFKEHFRDYSDQYILIGGTACSVAFESLGIDFRNTRDLDIVLCVEALTPEFFREMWSFIKTGEYQNLQKSIGKNVFYRFYAPINEDYPFQLEFFSRNPELITIPEDCRFTPIPSGDDVSSLSAILLDDNYYHFIQEGKYEQDGLSLLRTEYIIVLKAKAWLDMTERVKGGEPIDEKKIKQHRNDVFRLFQIIDPEVVVNLAEELILDLRQFLTTMKTDTTIILKDLRITGITKDEIIQRLEDFYKL